MRFVDEAGLLCNTGTACGANLKSGGPLVIRVVI